MLSSGSDRLMIVEIGGSRRVVDRRFLIDEYDQGKFPNSRHSGRVVLGSTAGITIAFEEFRSHSQPGTAARLRSGAMKLRARKLFRATTAPAA